MRHALQWLGLAAAAFAGPALATTPDFGPNVIIFDPSTPLSQIQTQVNTIATQQLSNQFGTQRYALLFKPGAYGASGSPLNFQVGYYTQVAGLGRQPTDVNVDGTINAYNQCDSNNNCVALNNFWRSLSNLTITTDNSGCQSREFWAVSQAAPMRRVNVVGETTLMDYCTGPSFASGGFIADSAFSGLIVNGSQQQWMTRNSNLIPSGWTNGVWNQVFSGVVNAPANCFPAVANGCGPYTTLPTSPVTREAPYLYVTPGGAWNVFVPATRRNTVGTSWSATAPTPGVSLPIGEFFIAKPSDSAARINGALSYGLNVILTPGVYSLDQPIRITKADTVVLGLGFPTLVPAKGNAAIVSLANAGVEISGVILDAGPVKSANLLQLGRPTAQAPAAPPSDPSVLHDVFVRVGGATAGSVTNGVVVFADNAILDDVWIWRADHGNGVGWTQNTANTGLWVMGDNVTAYGLAVEHFQKSEVIWGGQGGKVIFFQNEMPYDPPSQAAWMLTPNFNGYPALQVLNTVKRFNGYGMGSYSFFNQGVPVFATSAFVAPQALPLGSFNDLLTVFLNATTGSGGISNVINDVGGPSTAANADTPVTVPHYP